MGAAGRRCAGDHAIVVEPQQFDHLGHVVLGFNPAGCLPLLIREYGVKVDPPLLPQLDPDLVRKAGVENLIAVEVADLPVADLEGELAALSRARLDALPGGDLLSDRSLAACLVMTGSFREGRWSVSTPTL